MKNNLFIYKIFCIGLALTVFLSTLFSVPNFALPTTAKAQNVKYLRIINHDTPLYADKDATDIIFYLSYTYYVKVLDTQGEISHVECFGENGLGVIDGFVLTNNLFDDGLEVVSPYPNLTVETRSSCSLYLDKELTTVRRYLFKERTLNYYGKLKTEKGFIYFVGYNGDLGYVEEDYLYSFTLANHPNPLTFISTPMPDDTEQNPANDFLSLKIIIIVCLVFAGLIALCFALKKKRLKQPKTEYYDENDFS